MVLRTSYTQRNDNLYDSTSGLDSAKEIEFDNNRNDMIVFHQTFLIDR